MSASNCVTSPSIRARWVALLTWSAAAYKLKLREEWIGWSDRQKQRRLPLVVNNSRFFIPSGVSCSQSGQPSDEALPAAAQRRTGQTAYGHAVLMAESFVDRSAFRAPPTRPAAGRCWARPRAMGVRRRTSTRRMTGPKSCGCGSCGKGRARSCAGAICRRPCRAWSEAHPPDCPQSPEELRPDEALFRRSAGLAHGRPRLSGWRVWWR